MGGKGYNFLWLDNKLQQLLEPSHGGPTDPFSICLSFFLDLLVLCPSIFLLFKTYSNKSLVPSHCSVVKIVEYSTSYDLAPQLCSKWEPTDSVSNQDNETNTCTVLKSCELILAIYLHHEMPWPLLNVFFTPCTPN